MGEGSELGQVALLQLKLEVSAEIGTSVFLSLPHPVTPTPCSCSVVLVSCLIAQE